MHKSHFSPEINNSCIVYMRMSVLQISHVQNGEASFSYSSPPHSTRRIPSNSAPEHGEQMPLCVRVLGQLILLVKLENTHSLLKKSRLVNYKQPKTPTSHPFPPAGQVPSAYANIFESLTFNLTPWNLERRNHEQTWVTSQSGQRSGRVQWPFGE
jgi:hypothetical protein